MSTDHTRTLRIVEAMATDDEIVELAKAVFFSTDSVQARQLAAYIITRLKPDHEIDEISVEISHILARMVAEEELIFKFPNGYKKPKPKTEGEDEYIPHRTCRTCRGLKPLETDYGLTETGNRKTKCLECEAKDSPKAGMSSRSHRTQGMGRPPKPRHPDGKECTKCGEFQSYENFHRNPTSSDGRSAHCKECRKKPPKPEGDALPPTDINAPLPDHLKDKGHPVRFCSRGRLCLDHPDKDHPGEIPPGSPGTLCPRCIRAKSYG